MFINLYEIYAYEVTVMQLLKPTWVNHDVNIERNCLSYCTNMRGTSVNRDKAIFSVDIHPDGSRFATGGQGQDSSGRVVIWNLQPVVSEKAEEDEKIPKLLCQLDQHLGCVNSVRWSNAGNYLASAGDDKVIIIWQQSSYGGGTVFGSNVVNVESWRIVSSLRGHYGDILDVAWSPQDVWLASASIDNTVVIWNTAKWPEQHKVLRGHTGLVKGVTWDPIGRYIASQADDKSMRVWRTSNWTTEQKITEPFVECGGTTTILRPSWSPDGQYLVSAHAMNNGGPTAQIIDRDGWNTDKDFVGHRKAITCVRFNPNILNKQDPKTGKQVQYCCVAIGSRDRSISIWFTSLKRPLVVIHDIFEDSVLDLSWSKCGRYLMSVSKDGSLAFVNFSLDEIGKPLTVEQTNVVHMKLYGNTAFCVKPAASSIIENLELLRLKEEEIAREKNTSQKSMEEKRTTAVPPAAGPTNKQIEMRTADGRRRITPMFIPPPAEGSKLQNGSETSLPVTTVPIDTSVNTGQTNSTVPVVSTPDLEAVPAGLSARIGEVNMQNTEKSLVPSIPVKRKGEEYQTLGKKRRGRGRPPTYSNFDRVDGMAPPPVSSRPSSPVNVPTPLPTPQSAIPPSTTVATTDAALHCHLLPAASMPRLSRIQIPGAQISEGNVPVLVIENDWRLSKKVNAGVGGKAPSVHRVSRSDTGSGGKSWVVYITSPVRIASVTSAGAAFACGDNALHMINVDDGEYLLPPVQLNGSPSQLFVQEQSIIVLTTDASLTIWNFVKRKKVLMESVRHLVENRSGVKCVQMSGEGDEATPVVILKTGEAYIWYKELESWVQLGESAGVRRHINAEFSLLQPYSLVSMQNPLSNILVQSGSYSGSSRLCFSSSTSSEVKRGMTESFLKRMLTSARHLKSSPDFRFWYKRLAKFYISEAMEDELRKLFDDLLGPVHSGGSGVDKREMLQEFLKEILLAENSIRFQRLHSEYHEQLKGLSEDAI
ncbi:Protein HIRA [Armadillidium nasatum]|uniref:Protein HIRA n=1 Tax=Armadillidium nasatum TaxID=96803 RepID=A0A5N5SJ27_9CRUS|nr:Protein HIRA [Armadillidium nasatum]